MHWVKLGIRLERIEPGAPQQNGRHERMHATLKAETSRPHAATAAEQQARFDRFRNDFNDHRPHEALGQVPPTSRYRPSLRPYPNKPEEPWYDADHVVRKVRSRGEIRWRGDLIFLSEALIGEPVGIAETEAGDWLVRFAEIDLGIIDRRSKRLRRFTAGRRHVMRKPPYQPPRQRSCTRRSSDESGLPRWVHRDLPRSAPPDS